MTTATAGQAGPITALGHGVRDWPLVAVLAITETVSWGVLYYALPVLLVPMRRDLGWSTAEIAGGLSLALVVSALAGIPVGRWLDHRPPRSVMLIGSVLGAGLVAAWSQVESLLAFYLVWAGIGVAMAMVLYQAAFTVLSKWFASRRRDALTALTLVAASASLIFSPLTNELAGQLGWRDAVLALALVLGTVTVPLHALLPHRSPPPATPLGARDGHVGGRAALRSPDFWLLTGAFFLAALAATSLTVMLVPVLVERGESGAFAAFAAGIVGISQLPGRALFAGAARWLSPGALLAAIFGATTLAALLLIEAEGHAAIAAAAVLLGASNGMATLAFATGIGDRYGTANYGTIAAVSALFVTMARAAAPVSAAALPLVLAADSLEPALWAAGAASLAAVAAGVASVRAAQSAR